ncbi:amidohydrolase family protein [Roseibium sp. DSM 29163]|uniref:Amidohydrolase family protein n=1 Tax=Roseibium salinum TaxID=1604349 RepID=A0ABT3R590_9HYPH|nr:amidohydrolase family protein [Roseibium sp. DSM 29163]
MAQRTSAWCKLSGLVTEAPENWTADDLKPYVDHLLTVFGPARLIWGSDWPVCTLAATYEKWVATTEHLLAGLSEEDARRVWFDNAVEAYGLDVEA